MLMQNKLWFTASELADLQLSGLPRQKRDINRLARAENWAIAVDGHGVPQARKHVGPGGGLEYHVDLLRSEEPTSELQSLMRILYALFCLKKTSKPDN